jgi:hypothetical protein
MYYATTFQTVQTKGQAELFPRRLDDDIGKNDPVQVNQIVDELDLNSVIQSYKGGEPVVFVPG